MTTFFYDLMELFCHVFLFSGVGEPIPDVVVVPVAVELISIRVTF